eukprot:TRINITY_DN1922_c0_g1_i18.p1 TRINITY_DN1922_c0_g1~~TRINITY_DN1922_c0_g1_i18.p1  ORF type:complete len:290 (-),score=44.19 TRINITY_DN1922_c0_g1_i18:696-1565(-)
MNMSNMTIDNSTSNGTVCALSEGDTAWLITATLLVLAMKPGLALFEAGLLRSKNTVSVIIQIMVGMMILCFLWFFVGYSFTFGNSLGGFIGNPGTRPLLLYGGFHDNTCVSNAPTVPVLIFATFQMMFAAIAPLLQTGGFSDRMTFKAYLIYIVSWEFLVYYPVAHWIWGNGWLSTAGYIFEKGYGVIDFAGGIVIHTTAGISCFLASWYIGQRRGFEKHMGAWRPSNLVTASVGASLLWVGWFGFNAGSALASNASAALAVINTQMGGVICGSVWLFLHWVRTGKPSN